MLQLPKDSGQRGHDRPFVSPDHLQGTRCCQYMTLQAWCAMGVDALVAPSGKGVFEVALALAILDPLPVETLLDDGKVHAVWRIACDKLHGVFGPGL